MPDISTVLMTRVNAFRLMATPPSVWATSRKTLPVSLSFLVATLEKSINRELAGLSVKMDDFVVQQDKTGDGLSFRLRNIRLVDESPRPGAHGTQIAFIHPKASGRVLSELTQV